ncbi:hypothetical protein CHS0354_038563 [Potamilus streckersoni]|uniref:Carbonic anhydrase n=1 Tax=Potamilus streckersoni TaxID=2493646 RepID=A0AAE0RSE1_9BIVA|nr:hypothetical protein CHS0354_038563 [Potamilus streckersoni]
MSVQWGYANSNGPHTWVKSFPVAAGIRQSPVNISAKTSIYDDDLAANPIKIVYLPEKNMAVVNNGHSIQANATEESVISGGPLSGTYRLQQFHLHWGATDDVGSEHTINGTCYSAELHLVHFNCGKYKTIAEAVDKPDGLAVFGVMVEIGKEHAGFKSITDVASKVSHKGQSTKLSKTFDPSCLLPADTSSYWTYPGSLTTPPLYESVTWIVFSKAISISREQIEALRSLKNEEQGGKHIVNNYRPPLPLGDRNIRCSCAREA